VLEYRSRNPTLNEIPFNSTNKFHLTIHRTEETSNPNPLLLLKGAPERIVDRCSHYILRGEVLHCLLALL
jgi:magnesium-transporting ATPase (P-type)